MQKSTMNSSLVAQRRALEEQRDALDRQIHQLTAETEAIIDISERIRKEAKEHNIPLLEIAYALVPELAKGVRAEPVAQKRTRPLKRYTNPNNGEVIETKGGNHKTLKQWKAKYGGAVVESWLATA
jgi:hypothetical protein